MYSMTHVPVSTARDNLFTLVKTVINSHEPVTLTGKAGNVVLLSEEDFKALQETIYLYSIPDLVKDVQEGRKESRKDLIKRKDLPLEE